MILFNSLPSIIQLFLILEKSLKIHLNLQKTLLTYKDLKKFYDSADS